MHQRNLIMHQVMLSDRTRLNAYDEAISRTVRPGDVVADVGAGTLALSLLALRHGAGHVYAIEGDPEIAALARVIAEANGLHGRVTVIQADARRVHLPAEVDVVISEMMGNLGPEEEMAEVVAAVARRYLKPSGHVIPARVLTQLQAVSFPMEGWGVWSDDFFGFSLSAVQKYAPSAAQLHFFNHQPVPLSPPVDVADERLGFAVDRGCDRVRLEIVESGTLHAVIGYFAATLADGVTLSNHPAYRGCNWAVWVWPLRHTAVLSGQAIDVTIKRPADVRLATDWRLDCAVTRAGVVS